jgi:hypothetical protein
MALSKMDVIMDILAERRNFPINFSESLLISNLKESAKPFRG